MVPDSHFWADSVDRTRIIRGHAFVGRQREMAELKAALEDALAGRGRLVLLAGEPGIGKTRVAEELASIAAVQGAQTLWGRCYEEAGAPPYWPWVQPLRSYVQQQDPEQLRSQMGPGAADIAEIIPQVREKLPGLERPPSLEPEQARFRLFDSITTFLKNSSQTQSLMLVLDDLHWANKPSLLLLEFLSRHLRGSHLLVVGCYRDVELSRQHPLTETLAELAREPAFQRHSLQGLSQEDTASFIEVMAGFQPSEKLAERLHSHTEGNPFFTSEVVRLLRDQGALSEESLAGPGRFQIPEGVREVIAKRLNRRSEQCNQVLTVASVIGREFSLKQLGLLNQGLTEDRLLEVVEEALGARLVEEVPGSATSYRFCHALIQETLIDELSTARRVRLHARIAEALEEFYGANAEAHASELAYHFAQAEPILGPDKLVRYSLIAGERALAGYAWEAALQHFQWGVDALEERPIDSITARLHSGSSRALVAMAREREAVPHLKRAFDYYVEIGDEPNAVATVEYPYNAALIRNLKDVLEHALTLVPRGSLQHARLLGSYGLSVGSRGYGYERSQEAFEEALAVAKKEQDIALEIRILAAAANIDGFHASWQQSLERCLRALDLASQTNIDPITRLRAHLWAANSYRCLGYPDQAQAHATELAAVSESLHDIPWLQRALSPNITLAYATGNWERVSALAQQGTTQEHRQYFNSLEALSRFQRGEFEKGQVILDELLPSARAHYHAPGYISLLGGRPISRELYAIPAYYRAPGYISLLGACISRITGNAEILKMIETAALQSARDVEVEPFYSIQGRVALALIAVQRNDAAKARETYQLLTPHQGTVTAMGEMSIDHVLGLLARTIGSQDLAVEHFEDALTFCRRAGYRPELAWTCYDFADALLQRDNPGDQIRARSLLDESLAITHELGMAPLIERAIALQERAGSQPAKAPAYPDGLTQREVEVLRLLSAGKTDREIGEELFISVRTVGGHVGNILNKTNTSNRTEAAAYAARHGLA